MSLVFCTVEEHIQPSIRSHNITYRLSLTHSHTHNWNKFKIQLVHFFFSLTPSNIVFFLSPSPLQLLSFHQYFHCTATFNNHRTKELFTHQTRQPFQNSVSKNATKRPHSQHFTFLSHPMPSPLPLFVSDQCDGG